MVGKNRTKMLDINARITSYLLQNVARVTPSVVRPRITKAK